MAPVIVTVLAHWKTALLLVESPMLLNGYSHERKIASAQSVDTREMLSVLPGRLFL